MSPAVACKSRLATLTTPLREMSVPAVTSSLPVMFTPPSEMLLTSFSVTSLPPSTFTVPTNSLALSSVMSSPALRSVGPALTVRVPLAPWLMSPVVACKSRLATLTTPLSEISSAAVTSNLPVVVTPPSVMLLMSLILTSSPPNTLTRPLKSLALSSVMSSPAFSVVGPAVTVSVPAD